MLTSIVFGAICGVIGAWMSRWGWRREESRNWIQHERWRAERERQAEEQAQHVYDERQRKFSARIGDGR